VNWERWRAADDWTAAPAVQAALAELLRARLPEQHAALLAAAGIFEGIFPGEVYVGNGDVGGYTVDCAGQWATFAPFRAWFAAALPLAGALRREWVTLAQVYWGHFRWQADDWFHGTFSAEASEYLLGQAVELALASPIQYYYFYKELPRGYTEVSTADEGQELELQSGVGLTYFYYAQWCQYHGADAAQALDYYRRFLAAEPGCQPDNRFYLFDRDATTRSYPPSRQEALAEMGTIYWQQGQEAAARAAFEAAIAEAPDNVQAPYERLAALLRAQGQTAAALPWLARKAAVCAGFRTPSYGSRHGGLGLLLYYDPANSAPQDMRDYPHDGSWCDLVARVRVLEVNELYRELADSYFYELGDYAPAGHYYKRYLAGLKQLRPSSQQRARTIDASESQLRLALELGDYWQARSLGEKLLRLAPGNAMAQRELGRIRARFA
jgi:tetratricopeptide (TPR) repeat protein